MLYSLLCSEYYHGLPQIGGWLSGATGLLSLCKGKISLRIFVSISDSQDVGAMQITRLGLSHPQATGKPL